MLGSGSFADLLKAFGALPEEEKKAALAYAEQATAGMAWIPNPGPQTQAYFSEADELFYGGAGGGGKTALLCGLAVNCHYDIHLFRREGVQLRGLIKELTGIFGHTNGFNSQLGIWRLPTGQTIELAGVKDEDDKIDWQGRASDYKGFDEITHFSRSQYEFLIGWNRSTREGQRCRVVATGNPPIDENGLWVIGYWAPWLDEMHPDPAAPGELRYPVRMTEDDEDEREIFFRTKEEALEHLKTFRRPPVDLDGNIIPPRSRTFIPARLEDNPDLMRSGYAAVLDKMPKELRDAMRDGKFKTAFQDDEFQVIPTQWILDAQARWTPDKPKDELMTAMGVDIAQGGADRTVIAQRYGGYFPHLITKPGRETPDGPTAAALIIYHLRDAAVVNIDLGGGWGGSAYDHLKANEAVSMIGIVPGGGSSGRTLDGKLSFRNVRAEMWWRFREALDPTSEYKIALPPDPELRSELAAPKWKLAGGNVIQLEEKADIKKRIGRSPDKGDAVVMAWFSGDGKKRKSQQMRRGAANLPSMANLGGRQLHHSRPQRSRSAAQVYSASSWSEEQG